MSSLRVATSLMVASLLLFGCGGESKNPNASGGGATLQGAGASFPAPLYRRWFSDYNKKTGAKINYQSVGSGAGVKQFTEGLVNFGASDAAMKDEEIAKVEAGVVLLPMTAGSIVLAFNLEGVKELKLPREVYVAIFMGEIKRWNDSKIADANKGANLPDQPITVVRRSDGSGTTFVFTKHLSAISDKWSKGPGTGKSIEWPVGVGGKGNEGVTALIKQTPGAIGYIEFGYATLSKLPMASLENKSGTMVAPSFESAQRTLSSAEMPADLRAWFPDPEGKDAYPIVTYTWLLCYKKYKDPKVAEALKKAIEYCLTDGQKVSQELGYIPLPADVVEKVREAMKQIGS